MEICRVAEETYAIDPLIFGIKGFSSVYLLAGPALTLIDSGSPKSAPLIIEGIKSLGYRPKDVTRIILSHIHFDHGSGAGELLKSMPQALVYVHYKGYQHLIDPSRITMSAKKVFGEMIEEWYGGFAPVPKEKIIQGNNGDIIDLGGNRRLRVIETSGHAQHGICLYDQAIEGLFTGDEAGIYIPAGPVIIPTSPPPDFDPDLNRKTIEQLLDLKPRLLLFAHSLTTKSVNRTLRASIGTLISWKDIVGESLQKGLSFDEIVNVLRTETNNLLKPVTGPRELLSWIMNHHIPICARGYVYYFRKRPH